MRALAFVFIWICLLSALCTAAVQSGSVPSEDEKSLLSLVNSERERRGLGKLEWSDQLHEAALEHSREMAASGVFSHEGSNRSTAEERARKTGLFFSVVAENIARDLDVASAHSDLMQSPPHRKNILFPEFDHAAVGIVPTEKGLYITQVFARIIKDYTLDEGRTLLLRLLNRAAAGKQRASALPLHISDHLNHRAQSEMETLDRLHQLTPDRLLKTLAAETGERHSIRVHVFTTGDLEVLGENLDAKFRWPVEEVGVGFKRVRADYCPDGCFLVAVVIANRQ